MYSVQHYVQYYTKAALIILAYCSDSLKYLVFKDSLTFGQPLLYESGVEKKEILLSLLNGMLIFMVYPILETR